MPWRLFLEATTKEQGRGLESGIQGAGRGF